jgi:hypothetical protein
VTGALRVVPDGRARHGPTFTAPPPPCRSSAEVLTTRAPTPGPTAPTAMKAAWTSSKTVDIRPFFRNVDLSRSPPWSAAEALRPVYGHSPLHR